MKHVKNDATPGHGGFIQLLQNGERAAPLASVGVPDVDVVGRSVLLEALGGHQQSQLVQAIGKPAMPSTSRKPGKL